MKPCIDLDEKLNSDTKEIYSHLADQARANAALDGLLPNPLSDAIEAAILAGRISPQQAHQELLGYISEHKTIRGFMESREWRE